MNIVHWAACLLLLWAQGPDDDNSLPGDGDRTFGVLVMAHGGTPEWNAGVLSAVAPLQETLPLEVAFGMATADTIQEGVRRLERRGVEKIAVVRLFISGESFLHRTEQILGLSPGAPAAPLDPDPGDAKAGDHGHQGHSGMAHQMPFYRIQSRASFALSTAGLADAQEMGAVLVDRARALAKNPEREDLLILAHGPGNDDQNRRWIAAIDARAEAVRRALALRRVTVLTLREDWPEKRERAVGRIRRFVTRAAEEGGRALVIPFRVQGFGPYGEVLKGLDYAADGRGLIPHENVTAWIRRQIEQLRSGHFQKAAP